jgi:hypothetical protein
MRTSNSTAIEASEITKYDILLYGWFWKNCHWPWLKLSTAGWLSVWNTGEISEMYSVWYSFQSWSHFLCWTFNILNEYLVQPRDSHCFSSVLSLLYINYLLILYVSVASLNPSKRRVSPHYFISYTSIVHAVLLWGNSAYA